MSVFKIETTKDNAVLVKVFASKREAQSAGNGGHIIASSEDLAENFAITMGLMRDAFNAMSPKPINRFSDREAAVRRLWEMLQAFGAVNKPAEGAAKDGAGLASKAPKAPKAPKEKKAKTGQSSRKGSRREVPLEVPKGTANPYRVATASHKAFELAAEHRGLTFNQLVEKGARANTLAGMMREGLLKAKA